jgi:hypothetical protein
MATAVAEILITNGWIVPPGAIKINYVLAVGKTPTSPGSGSGGMVFFDGTGVNEIDLTDYWREPFPVTIGDNVVFDPENKTGYTFTAYCGDGFSSSVSPYGCGRGSYQSYVNYYYSYSIETNGVQAANTPIYATGYGYNGGSVYISGTGDKIVYGGGGGCGGSARFMANNLYPYGGHGQYISGANDFKTIFGDDISNGTYYDDKLYFGGGRGGYYWSRSGMVNYDAGIGVDSNQLCLIQYEVDDSYPTAAVVGAVTPAIPGIVVFAYDLDSNVVLGHTVTDAAGEYSITCELWRKGFDSGAFYDAATVAVLAQYKDAFGNRYNATLHPYVEIAEA